MTVFTSALAWAGLDPSADYDPVRNIPIAAFTGINGAGKTLLAVSSAIADMKQGRPVVSTVPIVYVDPRSGEVYSSTPLTDLRQLASLRDTTVLLDDIVVMFSSSTASASLPAEVEVFFQTARHSGVTIRWTAPDWMRAQTLVRGVTQACVNTVPLIRRPTDSFWPRPLIVGVGVADTTTGKKDATPTSVSRRRVLIPERLNGWGSYDTNAPTPLLGVRSSGGICLDCLGAISRPRHSEERHRALGLSWHG